MDQEQGKPGEPRYEVVWPGGRSVSQTVAPAPAVTDLNDKTICELWDWAFRGDQIYGIINEALRARFPRIRIVNYHTIGNMLGPDSREFLANLPDLLRQHRCDAVIAAVGA